MVAADELRLLIERVERLEEEKKGIADDIRDVYLEAKSRGYDAKIMRKIVALRKMETPARQEMEAILETYKVALGMSAGSTPIEDAIGDFRKTLDKMNRDGIGLSIGVNAEKMVPLNEQALYNQAVKLVRDYGKTSASFLQRNMGISYNQAVAMLERMEMEGVLQRNMGISYNQAVALLERMEMEGVLSAPDEKGVRFINEPAEAQP